MAKLGTIRTRGAVAALGLLFALPLAAREIEVGDQVVPIHDTDLRQGETVVDRVSAGYQHKVLEITQDRLRLQGRASVGWLKRTDGIPSPEAVPYFSERIKRDSKDWEALRARGRLWLDEAKDVEAIADFDAALLLNPKDARSWQGRGIARLNQKMFDDAIKDMNEWQKLEPADDYPTLIRAFARLAKAGLARTSITPSSIQFNVFFPSDKTRPLAKEEAGAIFADLAAAIIVAPTDAKYYYARAAVHALQRDYDKAISDLSQSTKLDPKAEYFNFRGQVWAQKQEYKRAIEDFDEALRLDPDYLDTYQRRGYVRLELDDIDGAIADLTKAISIEPQDTVSIGNRGIAFLRNNSPRMAIADADRAIRLDKNFAAAWFIRGQAWIQLGESKRAIADFDEYIRLDPKESGYVFRGAARHDLGKRNEAIADLREAVRLNPNGFASQGTLACFLATSNEATQKDREEALSFAKIACRRTEWKSGECLQVLAIVCAELGQFDKAADIQTAAVDLATENDVKAKRAQILEDFRAKKTCRESPFHLR